ncbi:tRNA nucleotidyltransferase (CCA-adding enzyme) [Pseudoalteromonas citrea]|uniref:tRNA nucleotidyltransferase (CCA-adding enzyme) n=2 Tax=Pseudoalteromonas citrea TaxID=43655 RepID=A0AAD4FTF9_9GAMM|nr:tRNA nucleotidyltransferase [Pseudoalteromonas citrea]KAF7774430.1 tRNA nucleotidyltransferase (CCA-adding enzyme) [Pseudoalteromonas citrea]
MKVYLVGGAVRDALLSRPIVERDYVVVGSTPAKMIALGYKQVGKDFPVFLHPVSQDEYALARTERKSGQGYGGFICDFEPTITLEQDLYRRDLTVNAIAQSGDGTLIDPYHGQQDLNNKILRHVGPAFSEDPLRVLRVARFAARYHHLGFYIADETMALMKSMVQQGELKTLTPERVWLEIEKSLGDGAIEVFTTVLSHLNALNDVQPLLVKWNEETHQKLNAQLAQVPKADPNYKVVLFCLWLQHACLTKLTGIEQTLKIPSKYAIALRDYCEHAATLMTSPSPKDLLKLFNKVDLWRRPERFELLINIMRFTLGFEINQSEKLKKVAGSTRAISAQAIIAKGFSGSEIKNQLNEERLSQITHSLHL